MGRQKREEREEYSFREERSLWDLNVNCNWKKTLYPKQNYFFKKRSSRDSLGPCLSLGRAQPCSSIYFLLCSPPETPSCKNSPKGLAQPHSQVCFLWSWIPGKAPWGTRPQPSLASSSPLSKLAHDHQLFIPTGPLTQHTAPPSRGKSVSAWR